MDFKVDKYIVYAVIVLVVAVFAFNFEKLTGYAVKDSPVQIIITNTLPGGEVLRDRTVARLEVKNSFPNQRIKVYSEDGRYEGYTFNTENCKVSEIGSVDYTCKADIYVSSYELVNNERYYFQALDRKGSPEGGKAFFTFKNG